MLHRVTNWTHRFRNKVFSKVMNDIVLVWCSYHMACRDGSVGNIIAYTAALYPERRRDETLAEVGRPVASVSTLRVTQTHLLRLWPTWLLTLTLTQRADWSLICSRPDFEMAVSSFKLEPSWSPGWHIARRGLQRLLLAFNEKFIDIFKRMHEDMHIFALKWKAIA